VILVAGGTGHLGTELIPRLTAGGSHVRVLTRNPIRARQRLGNTLEFAQGDVRDRKSLDAAMENVDAVISAVTGFGPGGLGPRAVDFEGNVNLIGAAQTAGVRRFVLVSMHDARPDHPMELARMKHAAEEAVRASRLEWSIVRPTAFMSLWAGIVGDPIAKKGKTTVFGRGDNPVNFSSERDVAAIVERALRGRDMVGAVVNFGGPDNLTFNQLVKQIEVACGRNATVRHLPVPVMRLSRQLMRPFKPDVAGMIQAGIAFDSIDMSFDATELRRRFPDMELTGVAEVVSARFNGGPEEGSLRR
jgi:uncharacterized protein YbjT (DUF2867 family)